MIGTPGGYRSEQTGGFIPESPGDLLRNQHALLKIENVRLQAETVALQAMLFELIVALNANHVVARDVLHRVFDHAADACELLAIRFGNPSALEHMVEAVEIVEECRRQFVAIR